MRTKRAPIKTIEPDPKYGSVKIAKLINYVMRDGKKSIARKQVYKTFEIVEAEKKEDPVKIFDQVLEHVTPKMEVRSRRVGGASYQVPMPVKPRRGFALALRWLVTEANKRPNKQYHTFAEKLAAEMLDTLEDKGGAIEKKNTSHRMAEANKAFAHFRW